MTITVRTLLMTFALAAGLVAVGCGGGDAADTKNGADGNGADAADAGGGSLPDGLFVAASPGEAQDVGDAKENAKEGEEIVVRGRIGGVKEPFTKGRATMTLADVDNVLSCADMEDDACTTPWDYCCEEPDELLDNTLTVQVVGDDGRPLKAALDGTLKPLAVVVVKGKVAPRPDAKVLIVNASAIYVEK